MITSAILMVALTATTGGAEGGTSAERLARQIVEKGYKRVGVLPRFIVRKPGEDEAFGGSIGPQAESFAVDLEDELVATADGRFQVVPGRQLKRTFKDLKLDQLGDAQTLAKAAVGADGLDALIIGTVVDGRETEVDGRIGGLNVRCQLLDVSSGTLAATTREQVHVTLGSAAYMGESWELRRWTDAGLENVGLAGEDAQGFALSPFGAGPVYEEGQYRLIRRDRPHPLLDPEFPYPMEILVGTEVRRPEPLAEKLYVTLEPGESYKIRVKNDGPRRVYLAVFVDGVNVLGKKLETPAECRYWGVDAGKTGQFAGWVTVKDGKYSEEEFMITPADDSVAAGQNFSDNLGMITAVVFSVGMKDVPEAPTMKASIVGGTFGTGVSGKSRELTLESTAGEKPGLILSAATIHYVTSSQLKRIRTNVVGK